MSKIRDMQKLYDIYSVLGIDSSRKVIVCPLPMHSHQNNTPSFSIFNRPDGSQYFRCHGSCGREGDVVDITGYMRISGYDPKNNDHVKRAITLLQSGFKISPPVERKVRVSGLPYDTIKSMALPDKDVLAYAETRGLTEKTLTWFTVRQYEAGGRKYMAIPTFHFGTLMGIKMRNINARGHKDRFLFHPGSSSGLFNYASVFSNSAPVLIVKAEIPAMLLTQNGINTCAPSGSENVIREELFRPVAWAVRRVVVKDNDPDPEVRVKMDKWARTRANAFKAELQAPPDDVKDIDEWVLRDGEKALDTIRGWLR